MQNFETRKSERSIISTQVPPHGQISRNTAGPESDTAAYAAGGNRRDASGAVSRHDVAHERPLDMHTSIPPLAVGKDHAVYDCPRSDSDESMHDNNRSATPAASPALRGSPPAVQIGRLSLEHDRSTSPQSYRGRGQLSIPASKRAASSELPRLPRPPGCQSPKSLHHAVLRPNPRDSRPALMKAQRRSHHERQHRHCLSSGEDPPRPMGDPLKTVRPAVQSHDRLIKKECFDSGYDSSGFPGNSIPGPKTSVHVAVIPSPTDEDFLSSTSCEYDAFKKNYEKYPGLILQPDSSPISQDQLAAEVKGIYAGLVMVEAKCISIDAAQAADPQSQLGSEQWQALIALHRTLLYEHHDFLMATQHPSATSALRGLATKYSMPARMWKHGIHAFLEVLRHRRPDSQDYMLSFIYLAYQMMALLYETVPIFTDTWIECLGDLARYRMAIEEEKEAHATWGGVAARWYTLASDRHPSIGRLYHHLGILERPSLRKLCFYAKSLTCVISFFNARDSLMTLCGPIVQDDQTIESSMQSPEARIVTFHALTATNNKTTDASYVGSTALELLLDAPCKLRDLGAYLGITNTAALFEFGSSGNILTRNYTTAINLAMQSSRPSSITIPGSNRSDTISSSATDATTSGPSLEISKSFWFHTFELVLRSYCSVPALRDSLTYVHVTLVCVHSLLSLRTRLLNGQSENTFDSPLDLGELPWKNLAVYLNTVAHSSPISARLLEYARQGRFLVPERKEDAKPLPEDFLIRGLIWVQFYFRPGWFEGQTEDDGRNIEGPTTHQSRMERVLWLGLYLAFHTEYLYYDVHRRVFLVTHAAILETQRQDVPQAVDRDYADADSKTEQLSKLSNPSERSSTAPSSSDKSEESWDLVEDSKLKEEPPQSPLPPSSPAPSPKITWAQIAATQERHDARAKVEDENKMDCSQDPIRRGYSLC